ncbi:MAG: ATP-binding protein [Desulfurivibrio sp.]|nr:ATP-binding protein [Desulfurivibrio sp.]
MTQTIFPRGISLRLTLALFLFAPLLLLLTLVTWYSLQGVSQRVEQQMQKDIELIARAVSGPLEHALERDRQGSLNRTLASAFRFSEVYGVYVYDREGRLVAASGPAEPEVQRRELVELAAEGDRQGDYGEAGGKQVYSYFVPLSDSVGRTLGLLQLTRDGSQFRDDIRKVRRQALILLALLSGTLLAVVLYAHHRIIGSSLGKLVQSMARISGGEHQHRVVPRGPSEIRQLAEGMNAMLDSIAEHEKNLARQREEKHQLENRLRQAEKMAAIGGLAAGVAHELGTPLSLVAGKAQRLLRREQDPENAAAFKEIREAVDRMSHIVQQLLDFGRNNQLHYREIDAARAVDEVVAQLAGKAAALGVELEVTGNRPAPRLKVDPVRLEQALHNLLDNALQAASGDNRPQPGRVRLGWFDERHQVGFTVEDNGPGISPELKDRLFEPFFTTKEVGKGTGLGLAVTHSVVSDHQGRLEVGTSREFGGALFVITLPHQPPENNQS